MATKRRVARLLSLLVLALLPASASAQWPSLSQTRVRGSNQNPALLASPPGELSRGLDRACELSCVGIASDYAFAPKITAGLADVSPSLKPWESKYWKPKEVQGTKVYQRNDLIDPARVDSMGRTNLQRMQRGLSPLGPDGKPINLHQVIQTPGGPLAEVTQSFHQQYKTVLHVNPNKIPSGINRSVFDAWRAEYWKRRALEFASH